MASATNTEIKTQIKTEISENKIMLYSKSYCPFCITAKEILTKFAPSGFEIKELDFEANGNEIQDSLEELTNQRTVPNIFIGGTHIGGCSDLQKIEKSGELAKIVAKQ